MQKSKYISSFFTLLLSLIFLAGTAGITVIIHSCEHCGDLSVRSGVLLSPEIPEDHCCESAVNHCDTEYSHESINECCHFKVDRLKLENYSSSEKVTFTSYQVISYSFFVPPVRSLSESSQDLFDIHNKHGGRYLITYNCQFLS